MHPAGRPSPVMIRLGKQTASIGLIREEGDFVDYWRAEEALAETVARGLFRWEEQGEYIYVVAADTVAEMLAHLEAKQRRAIIEEDVRRRLYEGMATAERGKEILIRQSIRISCLSPLAHPPTEALPCD